MRILIIITSLLVILKLINANLVICERNKCDEPESKFSLMSVFTIMAKSIEGQRKTDKYLKTLEKNFQDQLDLINADIKDIKEKLQDQKESESTTEMSQQQTENESSDSEDEEEYHSIYPIGGYYTPWQSHIEYIRKNLQDPKEIENSKESTPILNTETAKQLYDSDTYLKSFDVKNDYKSWTTVQRRQDGSVDFNRNWDEYKKGFGDPEGEFFVGLDNLHNITSDSPHELLVILEDFFGNTKYAHYDQFLIGSEEEKYQLQKLGQYHGNLGDYLRPHFNMYFSTKDRDNDVAPGESCAQSFEGAWWYYVCMTSNLNGPWRSGPYLLNDMRGRGITWGDYREIEMAYKTSKMMIRSKDSIM